MALNPIERSRERSGAVWEGGTSTTSRQVANVGVVIPALNEEQSIGLVVERIVSSFQGLPATCRIVVADNGSTDSTAQVAASAGAEVVQVPVKGYGAACMGAIRRLGSWPDILVFMDADGSNRPEEIERLLKPVCRREVDMVLGVRPSDAPMTLPQRWGTFLALWCVKIRWGTLFQDMSPYRSIQREKLEQLNLKDRSWGWTIEMQIQAVRCGLVWAEVPVSWEQRIAGASKISGTVKGVLRAGVKIVWTVLRFSFKRS